MQKKENLQLIPRNRFLVTTHRDSLKTTKKRERKRGAKKALWASMTAIALLVMTYPLMPLLMYQVGGTETFLGRAISAPLGISASEELAENQNELTQNSINNSGVEIVGTSSSVTSTTASQDTSSTVNMIPQGNTLVIPKIGVNISIIESTNAEWAWDRGAWRDPKTSTPDNGGNTALSAHRFRYRPPYQATFYLLDKLENGDLVYIYWEGKKYTYRVNSEKIVDPSATEVLNPTDNSIVTLITCHPLFSTESRLVITGELISVE
ncbi:MAG: class E sortase [Candidatus Spechtbacterales bacterium]|nr:class E sortase [Candidatus Spechtbacterales bacterium]